MLPLLGLKLVHNAVFGDPKNKAGDDASEAGKGLSDWGTHGRGLIDGPIWGNHCGGNWGGHKEPTDSLDAACQDHDSCWAACDALPDHDVIKRMTDGRLHLIPARKDCRSGCDFELIVSLEALPDSPGDWPEAPAAGTEGKARRFLKRAVNWFRWF